MSKIVLPSCWLDKFAGILETYVILRVAFEDPFNSEGSVVLPTRSPPGERSSSKVGRFPALNAELTVTWETSQSVHPLVRLSNTGSTTKEPET